MRRFLVLLLVFALVAPVSARERYHKRYHRDGRYCYRDGDVIGAEFLERVHRWFEKRRVVRSVKNGSFPHTGKLDIVVDITRREKPSLKET